MIYHILLFFSHRKLDYKNIFQLFITCFLFEFNINKIIIIFFKKIRNRFYLKLNKKIKINLF